MRLTRRGWAAVAVVLAAAAMSWRFGPRALNAVVVPLLVVLLAGVVVVARAERPSVSRRPLAEGFVGEERTAAVAIETDGAVAATVSDTVGDGLSALTTPYTETTLDGEATVAYDLRLEARGRRRVGPLSIVVSDVVGLVERRFEYEEATTVLVYPRVRALDDGPAVDRRTLAGVADRRTREEFDHLRTYQRGDPLQDVHWKSAAKRPDEDLVVTEYADDAAGAVTIAADCPADRDDGADEMASAAASVATALLERGATVGLVTPDATHQPGSGRANHRDLLGLLAVVEAGELPERDRRDADVVVRTESSGTTIAVDGREIPFDRLFGTEKPDRRSDRAGDGDARADREPGDRSEVSA
ncbi:hypothetical protein A6E15_00140 [Natrinema saccharevitans]|uniref:Uncharacterized protein n=1 Tax=Natrinema saccharevitans TaxID=301967 RepID=A0A1S8ASA9_9EURY|nr:DUF58 domain-containing protein [Natrinema saccharevitans]OLZ39486.1 hypothetical protein A6E15_00140 [Natrinema saccharevitans]